MTTEIVQTVRRPVVAVSSRRYHRGAAVTTVRSLLEGELRFDDDFGYDECTMWGADGYFNPLSSRENVKGIHVPLLCQGNTASHEFVNTEFNFMEAASEDRSIFMTEGSTHAYEPVSKQYGDPLKTTCLKLAEWLTKPGRFLE